MHSSPLAHFLAENDVPCPHCGYNLRGLTASVCPECKHDLQLKIDGDFAAIRYLPMVLWLLGLHMFMDVAMIATTIWNWVQYPLYVQGNLYATTYLVDCVASFVSICVCLFAWRSVRRAQRSGTRLIRAYVVCIVALLITVAIHTLVWVGQWIVSWVSN